MMEQPLVDVRALEVAYHTQRGVLQALYDVNFNIRPGEIVGVVGETGCGKSTVASSLLRLLPPNGEILNGQIRFKDQNLLEMGDEQLRRLRGQDIAMIFQDPMTSLNPVFPIGVQMVDIQRAHNDGRRGQRAGRGELRQRAIDVLEQVGIPDAVERIEHYPHQFSGGMRQRIMIAMALLSRPDLLVADEATASLDVTLEAQILELIKELRQKYNTAVLFISHDLGVIAQLCDRVIVMYAGHIVEQGDVYRLFEDPQHPYTRALLGSVPSRHQYNQRLTTIPGRVPSLFNLPPGCKFADRCPHVQPVCRQQEPQLLDNEGHEVRCFIYDPQSGYDHSQLAEEVEDGPVAPATPAAEATRQNGHHLIETRQLSTHFIEEPGLLGQLFGAERDGVRAVDDVDLTIARGEVVGLVGESGSGKTTLGRTILRLQDPTAGQIVFDQQDITDASHRELRRLRPRMQMIFQDPYSGLSPRLRVSYLLREPYKIHNTPREEQYSVSELLRFVGLSDEQAYKFPHELSGGQARRVGIARALAMRPDFIVADEPTSGLDVSVAASVLNLMRDLASQFNLTYLIITHNLNVIGYIASRVAVMYLGNLVEIGPTAEIFNNPAHPYSLALLSAISEPDPRQRGRRLLLSGEIPSPKNPPPGCRFHTRCPFVERRCRVEPPPLEQVGPGHWVACHRWNYVREHGITGAQESR